jgi:hypothetical protein
MGALPPWLQKIAPILLLLVAVAVVLARLPRVDLGHSEGFKRRRLMNWVPLGLTYAFLYFGRYNLSAIAGELDVAKLLSKADFNAIDGYGAWVYGIAFLLNGPLTDRFGGRATMLVATVGSALSNVGMALAVRKATGGGTAEDLKHALTLLKVDDRLLNGRPQHGACEQVQLRRFSPGITFRNLEACLLEDGQALVLRCQKASELHRCGALLRAR